MNSISWPGWVDVLFWNPVGEASVDWLWAWWLKAAAGSWSLSTFSSVEVCRVDHQPWLSLPFYPVSIHIHGSNKISTSCLREEFKWSPAVGQLAECFLLPEDWKMKVLLLVTLCFMTCLLSVSLWDFKGFSQYAEFEIFFWLSKGGNYIHIILSLYGFDLCRAMLRSELF